MTPKRDSAAPVHVAANGWVNISYSPCDTAAQLGVTDRQMNRMAARCAEFWLIKGFRLLFGHDWRDDGVMRSVGDLVERVTPQNYKDRDLAFPRMLNLVPTKEGQKLERVGLNAQRESENLLAVRSTYELFFEKGAPPSSDPEIAKFDQQLAQQARVLADEFPRSREAASSSNNVRLWMLRLLMTRIMDTGFRICFGGKTDGYSGWMAGIYEEAAFAFFSGRPLYLIGGFGGASADFAAALVGKKAELFGLSKDATHSFWQPTLAKNEPKEHDFGFAEQLAERFGIESPQTLAEAIAQRGLGEFSRNNGLSDDENVELFRCTDIELALSLIDKGVAALTKRKRN